MTPSPTQPAQPVLAETAHRDLPPPKREEEIGRFTPKRPHGMRSRPTECLNCGHKPLYSNYCPDCGQENLNYAVPLHYLLEDVFEEFLRWDGRLFRTVALLLFRPGRLTAEYNMGRRTRYMSPFKLFLGISTLFFLVIIVPQNYQSIRSRLQNTPAKTTKLEDAAAKANLGELKGAKVTPLGVQLNFSDKEKADNEDLQPPQVPDPTATDSNGNTPKTPKPASNPGKDNDSDFEMFGRDDVFAPKSLREGRQIKQGHLVEEYDFWQQHQKNPRRHAPLLRLAVEQSLKCMDDPQRFGQGLLESAAKAMFFLMPTYAFLLNMLFRSAKKYYVEHLVFAVNHHSFAFFIAALVVASFEMHTQWGLLLLPVYSLYEFIALRACYKQGKRLTLFKQFVLNQIYFLVVLFGLFITTLITVAFL